MSHLAVIYTRVSTDKQSHDSQLLELQEYCERRGWGRGFTGPLVISDTISGAKYSRTGLDELMSLIRKGRVGTVVCYKLDRLGRSLAHLAQLIGEFTTNNVALVVPSQGIDTSSSNPAARLQLNILCAVAEFEREIIRERVNAGLAAAKARGVKLGRPATVDRETAVRMRAEGASIRKIAKQLDVSSTAIFNILNK